MYMTALGHDNEILHGESINFPKVMDENTMKCGGLWLFYLAFCLIIWYFNVEYAK